MWRVLRWLTRPPDGTAACEAQQRADLALAKSRARGPQAARAARDAAAVQQQGDRIAEEIARTMRLRRGTE